MMPTSIRLLFFGVFMVVAGLVVVYLYRRLVRDVTSHRALRIAGATVLIALAGGALLARTLFRGTGMAQGLAIFLGLWIGVVLYTLLSLLVVDVVRLLTRVRTKDPAP